MVKKVKRGIDKGLSKYKCYRIDDRDTLFFEDRIVVPKGDLRKVIMNEAHNSLLSIHPGSPKMYHDLKQSYWWTRMKREIAQFVNECDVCRRVKAEHQRPAGLLQPLAIAEWKFDHIEMDFVTGFPKSKRGNDAIFVVIDKLSKVAHFLPIKESITAAQLAELYTSRIVSLHGIPQLISSVVEASSPLSSGTPSRRPWALTFASAQLSILKLVAKSSESIKFLKICSGLVSFPLA